MAALQMQVGGGVGRGDGPPLQPMPVDGRFSGPDVWLYPPGTIILCRPLWELYAHVTHRELPSWQLLARCVKVLAMALFRWHFYDRAMLWRVEGRCHSFSGRVEPLGNTMREYMDFRARYPHSLDGCAYFMAVDEHQNPALPPINHPFIERVVFPDGGRVSFPDFHDYAEISAQTLRDYFARAYRIQITDREQGNTIASLVFSRHLQQVTVEQANRSMEMVDARGILG